MAKTRAQKRSKLQEKRAARDVGGREQSGSGSSWSAKSDVRKAGELRVECKYTDKEFYSLQLKDLLKIRDEAVKGGLEMPAMQIDFAMYRRRYAVLDHKLWLDMLERSDPGRTVFAADLFAVAKSIRIHADDLWKWQGSAASRGEIFQVRITFQDQPHRPFAVVDWDAFTRTWGFYNS